MATEAAKVGAYLVQREAVLQRVQDALEGAESVQRQSYDRQDRGDGYEQRPCPERHRSGYGEAYSPSNGDLSRITAIAITYTYFCLKCSHTTYSPAFDEFPKAMLGNRKSRDDNQS